MAPRKTHDEAVSVVQARFPGAIPLDPYRSQNAPWAWRDPAGHLVTLRFKDVRRGRRLPCVPCGAKHYWTEQEATEWLLNAFPGAKPRAPFPGAKKPWPLVCPIGHDDIAPILANLVKGTGVCNRCAYISKGLSRRTPESEAVAAVQERFPGATPLESYEGNQVPWRWLCPDGHETLIRMGHIVQGIGMCSTCGPADSGFDSHQEAWFYLVRGWIGWDWVTKFGITNVLDRRMRNHRSSGFDVDEVEWLYSPHGQVIEDLEDQARLALKAAGVPSAKQEGFEFPGYTEAFTSLRFPSSSMAEFVVAAGLDVSGLTAGSGIAVRTTLSAAERRAKAEAKRRRNR